MLMERSQGKREEGRSERAQSLRRQEEEDSKPGVEVHRWVGRKGERSGYACWSVCWYGNRE